MQPDDPSRLAGAARGFAQVLRTQARAGTLVGAVVFGLSVSIALAWARAREAQGPPPAARVAVWATDRDADRVVGLDRDLLVVKSVVLRAPIEVEARSDGGAWVVAAPSGDPLGRHQLVRLSFDGTLAARAQLGPLLDLACDELDRAIVVDFDSSGSSVSVFDANALTVWRRPWQAALSAACSNGLCLIGTAAGELVLFDLNAPLSAPLRVTWGGAISDVAPGPLSGTWWALDSNATCRIALFDANLAVIWSLAVGLHALHLAPLPGIERVWIADTTEPHVRRYGPGGALEVDRADMPLGGLDRGCSSVHGGALFTATGALLRLDVLGQTTPGQAGFDFLVDVSTVRG